jgi:hypothetical protein
MHAICEFEILNSRARISFSCAHQFAKTKYEILFFSSGTFIKLHKIYANFNFLIQACEIAMLNSGARLNIKAKRENQILSLGARVKLRKQMEILFQAHA